MFHLNLQGHDITCDTAEEVLCLITIGAKGVKLPTSKESRARLIRVLPNDTKEPGPRRTNPGTAAWRVAKLYADKHGMTPRAARTYLKKHPRVRNKFVEEIGG